MGAGFSIGKNKTGPDPTLPPYPAPQPPPPPLSLPCSGGLETPRSGPAVGGRAGRPTDGHECPLCTLSRADAAIVAGAGAGALEVIDGFASSFYGKEYL